MVAIMAEKGLGTSVALLLILITVVAGNAVPSTRDARGCTYHEYTMKCVETYLSSVPKIPANIRIFIFKDNKIPSISRDTFKIAENPVGMEKIIFSNNRVVNITADAFDDFTNLNSLDLSFNKLNQSDLKTFLSHISNSLDLDSLFLNRISYKLSVEDMFSELQKTPSKNLFLQDNGIQNFSTESLKRLKYIQELSLDKNKLFSFKLIYMESLQALRLSRNHLVEVPNFCDEANISFTPNLNSLFMNYNIIVELKAETFMCLANINKLQLGHNSISELRTGFLRHNPKLTYFDIDANSGHNTRIERRAFSSNTLSFLKIGFNGDALSIFESIPDTFVDLPALTKLKVNYISMVKLTDELVKGLFSPLTNLTTLQCFNCDLKGDIKNVLEHKPLLTKVTLKNNYFETISPGIFTDISSLAELKLGMNKIAHVSQQSLPDRILNKLFSFDLSQNPFMCDCDIVWFVEWLKSVNKSRIEFYPEGYKCASPPKWQGKLLSDVHFSYLECHPFTTPEWIGIIGGPCVVLLVVLTLILYRNRWNIKHYVYLMRKRKNYSKLEDQNYEYDVFIGYNHADSNWVVEFLMPMLEGEMNLKLCIHDRDFHAGAFINDNIVEFMNKSRRVILVLSNNFTKSDWCMFELKLAHSFLVEDGVDVIAVLLETVDGKNMSKPLKVLLETTTYLEWTEDDETGRDLFVTKLKDSLGQ